jgi:Mrp family chromosome partitioning ATPase
VRNLALAFHESGKSVAVVDLDLRNPALATLFGVVNGRGVTEILRREVNLEDAMLEVGTEMPTFDEFVDDNGTSVNGANGHHESTESASFTLLLAGAPPANPPAVLASQRLIEILDDLRGRYDVVVIDSAPLLAVTDTVPLLRYADAALFVGRLGVTTRDNARRLTEFIARVPDATVLGVIANDLSRLEAGAYGYAYGYGYGYGSSDTKHHRLRRKATAEPPRQTV